MKRLGPRVRIRRSAQRGSGLEAELGHHLESFGGVGESGGEGIVAGGGGGGGELGLGLGAGSRLGLRWRSVTLADLEGPDGGGSYFTLLAYSALGVGFFLSWFGGLCDGHGHVIV